MGASRLGRTRVGEASDPGGPEWDLLGYRGFNSPRNRAGFARLGGESNVDESIVESGAVAVDENEPLVEAC